MYYTRTEKEMIVVKQTTEKQITDDTNLTIQIQTDSETESAIQAEQDPIPKKVESMQIIRKEAKFNFENQAEKLKTMSADKYSNVEVGQNVRLKVPDIDKAKTDPKRIIAVVIDVKDNEFCQLGTKMGILNQFYIKNQFAACSKDFIKIEEVVMDKEVSIREVVGKLSLTGGQEFKKCKTCRSSGLLCNSKCHNSNPCYNK